MIFLGCINKQDHANFCSLSIWFILRTFHQQKNAGTMKKNRRNFLKLAGLSGFSMAGNHFFKDIGYYSNNYPLAGLDSLISDRNTSIIGSFGSWAAGLIEKKLPLQPGTFAKVAHRVIY